MDFKVILVKSSVQEFEKLLSSGWKVAHAFQHPQGSLISLVKNKVGINVSTSKTKR
jgi:hypothetical protein